MAYDSIRVEQSEMGITITIDRPEHRNSINRVLLEEINEVLDAAEGNSRCRVVTLEGQNGFFCTGMDFEEIADAQSRRSEAPGDDDEDTADGALPRTYLETIKRFTQTPKVVVSIVDGQVMGGGVGLVAASDLAIATPRSQFSLSEALWGLLPAMVAPYLIRRVGYQMMYRMALTTLPVSAQEAHERSLVDVLSETPQDVLRRYWLRLVRLEEETIENMKRYFRAMWFLTDEMEEAAVREITRLSSNPRVIENITNFVRHQRFPWDAK